jgi:hypothetical protein
MKETPGYSLLEETILNHLYENPSGLWSTLDLVRALKPSEGEIKLDDGEQMKRAQATFDEVQYAVETLIKDRLVNGELVKQGGQAGKVYFLNLKLTNKGMAAAIEQKRHPMFVLRSILDRPTSE